MTGEQTGLGGDATAYGVSEEVWREIVAEGERASEGERRALLRAAGVVGLLSVVIAAITFSGLVTARLSGGNSGGGGADPTARTAFVEFTMHNQGLTPVDVVRWTSKTQGVDIARAEPQTAKLGIRGEQMVRVFLHVTDCTAAVPAARRAMERSPMSGAGLGVVVDRPWGDTASVVYPVAPVEDEILFACGVSTP